MGRAETVERAVKRDSATIIGEIIVELFRRIDVGRTKGEKREKEESEFLVWCPQSFDLNWILEPSRECKPFLLVSRKLKGSSKRSKRESEDQQHSERT